MTAHALLLAFLAAAPGAPSAPHRYDAEALDALAAMERAAAATNDYTARLVKRELRGSVLTPEETIAVKWQRPQRVYLHEIAGPREGEEILYAPGWNKDRIRVHGGTFTSVKLNLDPYGNLAMAHAHQAVPEFGLIPVVARMLNSVRRAQAKNEGSLVFGGRESALGRPALKLEATAPPTGTTPTIEKGQTLWDIARATGQSMYVILHANEARGWRQADHPDPGDAVIVPEFYGGRLALWNDDETHLPLQLDVYDHDGRLFEHYEYHDLAVNVGLTDADFDPKNSAYHF